MRRVVGLFCRGAKIINMDMGAMIMRMRRQSHSQNPTPNVQYQSVPFS